jgi:O-antigen/teichoic acid export membrane protein
MILRQIATNGIFKIGIQVVTLLTTILIARLLGSQILGEFNFATSLVAIVNVFFINSISSANISLLNKKSITNSRAISSFLTLSFLVLILYCIVVAVYTYLTYYNQKRDLFLVIIFLMLSEVFGLFFLASNSFYTATLNQYKASFPDALRIIVSKILQIGFVFWFGNLLSLAIGILLATILMTPFLIKFFWPKIKLVKPKGEDLRIYMRNSIDFMSFTLTKIVPQQLDKIFLEQLVLFSFIGYYTIGQKIGNSIEMVAMSVGVVLFPYFTKLAQNKEKEKAISILDKFTLIYFNLITFPLFVICFFSKELLIMVFGTEYIISTFIMQSYIIIGMLTIFMMPFNTLSIGFGKMKYINITNITTFGLFLICTVILFLTDVSNDENIINIMAIIRLLPNLILLTFFLAYTSKLLKVGYLKYLLLLIMQITIFIVLFYSHKVYNINVFSCIMLLVISLYLTNFIFELNPYKLLNKK